MSVADPSIPNPDDIPAAVNDTGRLDAVAQIKQHTRDRHVFEVLSSEASSQLNAPVALISLVAEDRDLIFGQAGLPDSLAEAGEITALPSFCQLTITSDGPVIIPDAQQYPTLRLFPSVVNQGVRAHLGIPLIVNNQPIGNCCVIDFKRRDWTEKDVEILQGLADAATEALTKASLNLTA